MLVTGGGTGGHVFPGVAVARELARRGWAVSFAGRSGEMEEQLAVKLGIPFHAVAASPLLGRSMVEKASTLAGTVGGAWVGRRLVRDVGADVVVGMGGYVSVPVVLGGWLARRPTIVFEPNAAAGMANRWLSKVASEGAVAFESAASELSCQTVVTGTPGTRRVLRAAGRGAGRTTPTPRARWQPGCVAAQRIGAGGARSTR